MKKHSTIVRLVIAAILVLSFAAAAGAESLAEKANATYTNSNVGKGMYPGTSKPGSITVGITTMTMMNTIKLTYNNELGVARHCFDALVKLDPTNSIVPAAAESWESSDDGMKWTFKLRPAKWVDTNGNVVGDVKASDFVFAWRELLNPDNAAEYWTFAGIFKNAKAYYEYKSGKEGAKEVKIEDVAIRAIDDRTLEFELEDYLPYVLQYLKFEVLSPICEEYYKKVGADKYGTAPDMMVYSGPFRMTGWVEETSVTLTKNPEWWDAANVELEEIVFAKFTNDNTRLNAFQGGELDMFEATGDQRRMFTEEGYDVSTFVGGYSFYYYANNLPNGASDKFPNGKLSVMRSKSLRRAISAAIDRRVMIDTVFKNANVPSQSFAFGISGVNTQSFSDAVIAANGGKPLYSQNAEPEKAKELLAEALKELGLKDASEIDLTIMTSEGTQSELQSQVIQEQLRRVLGIEAKIEVLTISEARARRRALNYDMFSGGWGPDYNDPMTDLDVWETSSSNSHTGYDNADYDALLAAARVEHDPVKREQLFVQCEFKIRDDQPIIPLYWRIEDFVQSEKIVSGAVRCPFQFHYLTYTKLAK